MLNFNVKSLLTILQNNIGKRFFTGSFWAMSGAIVNRGSLLFTGWMLVRMLGRNAYGEYGMIRSTLSMFIVFTASCMGLTATKYVAEFRTIDRERAGRIIGLSISGVVFISVVLLPILYFKSDYIAIHLLNSFSIGSSIRLGLIMVLFSTFNGLFSCILSGFEDFKKISICNAASGILLAIFSFGGAYKWGLQGALYALVLYFASSCFMMLVFLRSSLKSNSIKVSFHDIGKEFSILIKFSVPSLLNGYILTSAIWAGNAFLVNGPDGYSEMAAFDVINQWRMLLLFFPTIAGQIILPMLSNLSNNHKEDFLYMMKLSLIITLSVVISVYIVTVCFGKFIMSCYGNDYVSDFCAFVILLTSAVMCTASNVYGYVIQSRGYAWTGCFFNIFWSLVFLTLCYYLVIIQKMGVLGLSISYLVSYVQHLLIQSCYVYFYLIKRIKNV